MSPTPIPRLQTPRLILRTPREDDFPAYAALMASPRATFMGGPYDTRAAWGLFCHDIACWNLYGHGALMIDLPATGQCIGSVGINHGPLFPEKELGWFLHDGHEGHGYATEAALALRNWASRERRLPRLVSYIDPANTPSIAVARRMGAIPDPTAPRMDPGDLVFRHCPPNG